MAEERGGWRRHGRSLFAVAEGSGGGDAVAVLGAALAEGGAGLHSLLRLTLFHRGAESETAVAADAGAALEATGAAAEPALSLVPLPPLPGRPAVVALGFAYDGPEPRSALPDTDLPSPFAAAVSAGPFFVSGLLGAALFGDLSAQSRAVMRRLQRLAGSEGLTHALKTNNYYLGSADVADWSRPARVRAEYFPEPGPAATGMPLPTFEPSGLLTRVEVTCLAAPGPRRWVWPEGHWDWPIALPYKHGVAGGGLIHIGGQVALTPAGEVLHPDDALAQTRAAMAAIERILAGFGLGPDRLLLLTAFHAAGDTPVVAEARHLAAAAGADPLLVEVALPALAYPGMIVEIEAVAADR